MNWGDYMGTGRLTIVEQLPTAEEYNRLRAAVGWKTYGESSVSRYLPASLFGASARDGEELVGMARVVGDGGLVFYIQDVIVVPERQRCGIGSLLMDRVMEYIRRNAFEQSYIGLMSAKGKEPFYEKYGFTVRPTEILGAGMTIFWKAE
jgi:GNAT superfamily N-acetyltransferase